MLSPPFPPSPPSISFDQGTLVASEFTQIGLQKIFPDIDWEFDRRIDKFRCNAIEFYKIENNLQRLAGPVEITVADWHELRWPSVDLPTLRPHQTVAMECFLQADRRGVIVMPTGTGKTIVGLSIAAQLHCGCLIVAPIRDLMYQWHRKIQQHLGYDAGIIGDNVFNLKPVSVTTYDSAAIHMQRLGNQFQLIIFDECHHLPGQFYQDAALMSAAPWRLGLTATPERRDGRHRELNHLIGPTVYELPIQAAAGQSLARYQIVRIPVTLDAAERERYDHLSQHIQNYVWQRKHDQPDFDWTTLCKETNLDREARAAMKAFRGKQAIENRAQEKLRTLEDLFALHVGEPVIVFTGSNAMARDVSLRFLIPCLLSHCGKKERTKILSGFEQGIYPAIVANQILDEGVDLPDAKVAIVIGGSSSTRQAKQRLGRILRQSAFGEAVLYEVVLSDTAENQRSRTRRRSDAYKLK